MTRSPDRAAPDRADGGDRARAPAPAERWPVPTRRPAPLPTATRAKLEAGFGRTLDDVRIHPERRDVRDAGLAAVTLGADVFFAPGRFEPQTAAGEELIAHEAFHTLQGPGAATDERIASEASALAIRGRSAAHLSPPPRAHVQRSDRGPARARGSAELAPTPGGLRVGALDPAVDKGRVAEVRALLDAGEWSQLDRLWHNATGQDLASPNRPSDVVGDQLRGARDAVTNGLSDATRGDVGAMLLTDVAVLVAERFATHVLDARLRHEVEQVCDTYRQLVTLHRDTRLVSVDSPKATAQVREAFVRRGNLFIEVATRGLSPGAVGRVYAGLAADANRLLAQAVDYPLRGGELLVYELLDAPLQDAKLATLRGLFARVLDEVRGQLRGPAAGTDSELLGLLEYRGLESVVIAPLRASLDEPNLPAATREDRRQRWAIVFGDYLAMLDASNAGSQTSNLTLGYAAMLPGWVIPADYAAGVVQINEAANARVDVDAPVARPATATPVPAPVKPVHPYRDFGYGADSIGRWLRSYFTDRAAFRRWRFDAEELVRQFHPGTDAPDLLAEVRANIAEYRGLATQLLGQLDALQKTARTRFAAIGNARKRMGAHADAAKPPDYVGVFGLDQSFTGVLPSVAVGSALDDGHLIERVAPVFPPHFIALNKYMGAIGEALDLVSAARRDKLDVYLTANYPDTYGAAFTALATAALGLPRWPTSDAELHIGDELALQVSVLGSTLEQAAADRDRTRREAIENEVASQVSRIVAQRAAMKRGKDHYTVAEIWPELELHTLQLRGDEALARGYLADTLERFAQTQLAVLPVDLGMSIDKHDTLQAVEQERRLEALARELTGAGLEPATKEEVERRIRADTSSLVSIYAMAQGAIAFETGTEGPGAVVRTTNLINYVLAHTGAMTLTAAITVLETEAYLPIRDQLMAKAGYDELVKDTDVGGFDRAQLKLTGKLEVDRLRNMVLFYAERKGSVLHVLLDAEAAGGGDGRKAKLLVLARQLEKLGGSAPLAAAAAVYSVILEAEDELRDPADTVRQEDDADRKKGINPIPVLDWIDSFRREHNAGGDRDDFVDKLKENKHPVPGKPDRALTLPETLARDAWIKLKGKDHWYSVGAERWAHFADWAKGLAKMAAVAAATGGVGEVLAPAAEVGGLTAFTVRTALFTVGMRGVNQLSTLRDAQTGFLEDFGLNFVMMGSGELARAGAAEFFAMRGVTGVKAATGVFAAEYATFMGVGVTHLLIRSLVTHQTVTASDLSSMALENFGALVAFRAAAALGATATRLITDKAPELRPEHAKALASFDEQIAQLAKKARDAKTPEEAMKALDEQADVVKKKVAILRGSGIDSLKELGDELAKAHELYTSDVARARLATRIKLARDGSSPNFTYEAGGANEKALREHLKEQGFTPEITKSLDGPIFEVKTPRGTIRFRPRPRGAASKATFYSDVGRLEGDPAVETRAQLVANLAADPLSRVAGTVGDVVVVRTRAGMCNVMIEPVDAHSVDGPHASGPAVMPLPVLGADGTWTVTVEVRRNTPHDQQVRAVNHELVELGLAMEALAREAAAKKQPLQRYLDPARVAEVVDPEAMAADQSVHGAKMNAHQLAELEGDVTTLAAQFVALTELASTPMTPEQAAHVDERVRLALSDLQRIWAALDLPVEKEAFAARISVLRERAAAAGHPLNDVVTGLLEQLRTRREVLPNSSDLVAQIALNELSRVMTRKMYAATMTSFQRYVDGAILAKARARFAEGLRAGEDQATALAAAVKIVFDKVGGLSVASMRGFVYEGMAVAALNASPEFVAAYGRLVPLEPGAVTHDAYALKMKDVKGAAVKGVEGKLLSRNVREGDVTRLRLVDEQGTRVYEQLPDGTIWVRPGVEITFISFKAKSAFDANAVIDEMAKAIGEPGDESGNLFGGSKEYRAGLELHIEAARHELSDAEEAAQDRVPGARARRDAARWHLNRLEWYRDRIAADSQLTHADYDALLSAMRDEGLDPNQLAEVLLAGGRDAPALDRLAWKRVSVIVDPGTLGAWRAGATVPPDVAARAVTGRPGPAPAGMIRVRFDVLASSVDLATGRLKPGAPGVPIVFRRFNIGQE